MTDLFYDAAPNATRVAPPLAPPRQYPANKPAKVYLFGTCVVDLFFPDAGMDAIHLLEREGIAVSYPQGQTCCGQPAWTSGYSDQAREVARAQLALFEEDWPVVVPSGSCAGMFREHYVEVFKDEPANRAKAQALAERTYELAEFLLHVCKVSLHDQGAPAKVALHTSCSARREMNTHLHGRALLAQLANVERVEHEHESECCGFGGTFSVRMPDISGAMVQDKTRQLIGSGADQIISADCGCLMNINGSLEKQRAAVRGQHLASFLWQRTGGAQ
ncbi:MULTISPECIES: (Fe-S)-binding protein [unclassified Pseudomonas]|uniref:(Fe-S)-binding protein n=1 Tax=unclassified Pseudomonas TaxID=196821 RepID=UPI000BDA085E|nr:MULTISPECIES: (Fe-S)-binding protein [unclassified Pseudomonas]PVZ12607.1 L-lactate dehydrogenase complex protein LldE [Pseudomonas sp. URIL14HWK12:I12]PVZ23241.1 L-lactate dehydrogenase complex protein LldE [Pseudomonas sp. URIL14HWK12:I10]PVZ32571.1 L-lactate dehydrogenase complex protein LldE [Pseudomonas sp. URIL14HWK12:I11]SNZ13690.1 L-lactate dehydrogenase complex protein LldE [Pseudomonas sp. URIL14HWK12:I9]